MKRTNEDPIQQTIAFWRTKAGVSLTPDDAREVVANVTGFFQVLSDWDRASRDEGGER